MRWPLGPVFDHRTLDIYRTISILLQVAGWLAFLACLYTLQAGKAARRFYEAEWATEANALPQADALPQDSPSNPAPDRVVAFLDDALAKPLHWRIAFDTAAATTAINPDQVQAVLNSTGTLTNKLRTLATLANLQWRHTRGHKKHMRNGDVRSALAPVLPADILAQLS